MILSLSAPAVRERFATHMDRFGLVHHAPTEGGDPSSNNGLVYTSQVYTLQLLTCGLKPGEREEYYKTLAACEDGIGLLDRYPGCTIQNTHDDYTLVAVACYFLGIDSIPQRVLWRLSENDGFFDTDGKPEMKDFLYRFPGLFALMRWAAREKPLGMERVWLAFQIAVQGLKLDGFKIVDASPGDTSGRCLNYFRVLASYPESALCRLAAKLWFKRMERVYPRGVVEAFEIYFRENSELVEQVRLLEAIRKFTSRDFGDLLREKRIRGIF